MNGGQRLIKILATAFGICLAVAIIGTIVGTVLFAFRTVNHTANQITSNSTNDNNHQVSNGNSWEIYDFAESYSGIDYIDVNSGFNNICIEPGNEFRVEMKDVSTKCLVEEKDSTIIIYDKERYDTLFFDWFQRVMDGKGNDSYAGQITITVPSDAVLKEIRMEAGVGNVDINDLAVDSFRISAGVGDIEARNIKANYVDMDGGTGDMKFHNVDFNGLVVDAGVGNVKIDGSLLGRNTIHCGVGNVTLDLSNAQGDYGMKLSKGVGDIKINGTKYSDYTSQSASLHSLSIDGGVGNINVNFRDE